MIGYRGGVLLLATVLVAGACRSARSTGDDAGWDVDFPAGRDALTLATPADYDFLLGAFDCAIRNRVFRDGEWEPHQQGRSTWRGRRIMEGAGMLDEYVDEWGTRNVNVRVFDPEAGLWRVHWTAVDPVRSAVHTARKDGAAMVMETEQQTESGYPYLQRVSFRDFVQDGFRWINEVVHQDGSSVIIEILDCRRTDDQAREHGHAPGAW